MILVLADIKKLFLTFQLPRVRPRHEPTTATSGTMMEGGMQLLNRDGHSISHNSKRHYHDSFVSMNRMRQRGLLCDIVLHVSNKEIKAHKVVLASCSPYFHAMFTSKFSLCYGPWWCAYCILSLKLTKMWHDKLKLETIFLCCWSLFTLELVFLCGHVQLWPFHPFSIITSFHLFLFGAQVVMWGVWKSDFLPNTSPLWGCCVSPDSHLPGDSAARLPVIWQSP